MPFNQQRVGHLTYEIDPRHTALALLIRGNSVRGAWAQPAYPQRISALIGNLHGGGSGGHRTRSLRRVDARLTHLDATIRTRVAPIDRRATQIKPKSSATTPGYTRR